MRFILWEHSTKWQLLGLCSIYSSEIKIPEPSVPVSCTITTGLTMPSCVPQDHREVVMTQGHSSARFSSERRYLHRECSCRSVSPSPLLVLDPQVSPLNKEVLCLTAESSVLQRGFCRLCWLFSRMLGKHHVFRPTAPVYLAFFL